MHDNSIQTPHVFTWARRGKGYEISTKGDKRFSAMVARMRDGRTIEMHYQCDVKRFDPGGRNWRLGKGKPPLDTSVDLWEAYLGLWRTWGSNNPNLLIELASLASVYDNLLTDGFASTPVNQARALSYVLNETFSSADSTKWTNN